MKVLTPCYKPEQYTAQLQGAKAITPFKVTTEHNHVGPE